MKSLIKGHGTEKMLGTAGLDNTTDTFFNWMLNDTVSTEVLDGWKTYSR
jgi:hypothetical protein